MKTLKFIFALFLLSLFFACTTDSIDENNNNNQNMVVNSQDTGGNGQNVSNGNKE